ncbi:MAG: ATP-dependent helicase [Burkholderiaceae bacterium]
MDYLKTLNSSQTEAALWNDGPLLVLAGPGSGKTKTLTARVARIIGESSGESFRILCLTFTKKAATEMRERLFKIVPDARDRALLSTFHSFATDILRQHGSHFGLTPEFEILERSEQVSIIKHLLAGNENGYSRIVSAEKALDSLEFLFRGLVPNDKVASLLKDGEVGGQLAALFAAYKQVLRDQNALDYGAILYFCEELLTVRPRLARQLRTVYKYICVDEFQDTNLAQYQLLRALTPERDANLFIVGDDDQIIYQWNGASPTRINELERHYDLKTIQLPENYRCPAEVVDIANALIEHNGERTAGKKPLKAMRGLAEASPIGLARFDDEDDEAAAVATHIAERLRLGTSPSEIVVLARNTRLLERVGAALTSVNVEAHVQRRKSQFESAPVRLILSALKLAAVRSDVEISATLTKALSDCLGNSIEPDELAAWSAQTNGDNLEALVQLTANRLDVPQVVCDVFKTLAGGDYAGFVAGAFSYFDAEEEAIESRAEGGEAYADYPAEREIWRGIVRDLGGEADAYALPLGQFLQELALANKSPEAPLSAVRCLTVHASKGMEFRHVYLIGMAEDQLPSFQARKAGDDSREMQEERRNCFVAITRTMESLNLSYAGKYNGWRKQPSRFLAEMGLLAAVG